MIVPDARCRLPARVATSVLLCRAAGQVTASAPRARGGIGLYTYIVSCSGAGVVVTLVGSGMVFAIDDRRRHPVPSEWAWGGRRMMSRFAGGASSYFFLRVLGAAGGGPFSVEATIPR